MAGMDVMLRHSQVRQNFSVCVPELEKAQGKPGWKDRATFSPLHPVASVMSRQLGSHLTWAVKRP